MNKQLLDVSTGNSIKEYICELEKLIEENKIGPYSKEEVFTKTSWDIIKGVVDLIEVVVKVGLTSNEKINILHIEEAINFLVESINNTDYMLVSDIFQYEVVRILDIWKEEIENLISE